MDSQGPILFRQERMGYRGEVFRVFKFRTMRHGSALPDARNSAMTQSDDARITRIGRFLRTSRIDELPQIINILRGEMSWIGPRPEAVALSQWYSRISHSIVIVTSYAPASQDGPRSTKGT